MSTRRKIILHFNNYAITGGVPCFIADFTRTFPEFQHVVCSLKEPEEYELIKYWQELGIRYMHANKITRDIIEDISPLIVVLHNIQPKLIEAEYAYDIFFDRRVIAYNHNVMQPIKNLNIDLKVFVSNYIKGDDKEGVIIHPCIYASPYLNISRPKRKITVGAFQSSTRGSIQDRVISILKSIPDIDLFIVDKNTNNIKIGKMPEYLGKIDILAMWTNGPESWNRITTEAMLSGIPVVVHNNNDGLAEQMRKSGGGYLVKSEKGFIEGIEYLRDHEEKRKEFSDKGKKWALKNCSNSTLRKALIDKFLDWL